jgi:hypothetical protein
MEKWAADAFFGTSIGNVLAASVIIANWLYPIDDWDI